MNANIIPFESQNIPAHILALRDTVDTSAFGRASASGFPAISIKGRQFAVVRDGARSILNDPRTGEPAASVQLAIIKLNPKFSKTYYAGAFQEGVEARPVCFSNDGIRPDARVETPQCSTCALCPLNAFKSAPTGNGKACKDSRRLAVAAVDALNDPMLLSVPATSLKNLANFGDFLQSKSVDNRMIVVKLAFDPHSTHQVLTFTPAGFLSAEAVQTIDALQRDEKVLQITGESIAAPAPAPAPAPEVAVAPAPEPAAPKAEKPKAKVRQDIPSDLENSVQDFLSMNFDDD